MFLLVSLLILVKQLWQAVCGDGLRAGAETCDDQNTSNGDGCTSTCTIESNYIWTGGTTSSKDTCSSCPAGQPPNSGKTACAAVWGDGLRAGSEECDDQNTANSDGWSSTCTIEANSVCSGGTTSSKDTCSICTAGQPPNSGKTLWQAVCGDGLRAGAETCDDQNTSNGDGCSSTCTIESNYICTGGTTSSKDTCSSCPAGQPPNSGKTACVAVWGDGLRAGAETCDDQNTSNGDGCSSTCTIESNYIWTGGTTSSKDTCSACPAGQPPDSGKTSCQAVWGDGLRAGSETCDDQNTSNGDGCSSTCTIESNYICTGGSTTGKDTCSACPAGQPPNSGKTLWQAVCGDGLRAGAETCDDQNTSNGDGCTSTCTIESNYIWTGGTTSSKDTCSSCPAGQPPNSGKTACAAVWGDGLRAGSEECDDQNTANSDGWSSTCTIEANSVCSGGTTSSKDTCSICTAGQPPNSGKTLWQAVCGDGLRAGAETCDDQNTSNGDGCSSTCTIESNYICTGGTTSSKDTCSSCPAGQPPNSGKTACVAVWGDGLRAGAETCDDQNTSNGDGCSSTCTIESNYIWTGGTTSSKDTCSACPAGQPPDSGKTSCQAVWGDGLRAGSETCDDQNTSNGDGCSSTCTIESNYICTGGSTTGKDTCSACPAGQPPNSGKTLWQAVCGDGLRAGAETCDDQNTSNGDGCTSTCTIESNYIWTGGTTSSKDTCSSCPAGQPPNSGKTACAAVWGDGLRAGSEECDDQNTANSDGWSSTCTIEANSVCSGGTTSSKDTCSICTAGQPPNSGKTLWQAVCGDGLRAGAETCDDQNTSNGDGCSSTCTIESNYICTGGTTSSKDTCSSCPAGQPPNSGKTACVAVWGDGLRAGAETCDDQNTSNGDGCSSTCTIESNYIWTGGTTSSKDTCSACPAGQPPDSGKTSCQAVWGDGLRAGSETCDDQNTSNGDGCSSTCTIESNYICTGGSTTGKDTCSACPAGQPPNSGKTLWQAVCGDGLRAGAETCDDQNTSNGDGCTSTCTIESNYIWTGGTTSSKDTCSSCPAGQPPNSGKTACAAVWGDGLRAGSEECDDQNTANSDGWSSTCTIEANSVCSGGTTSSKDTCSICTAGQPPNSGKTLWQAVCGDGLRAGAETCDDQNTSNGDGCSSTCTIESNYICTGGTTSSKDTCSSCPAGQPPNSGKTACVAVWGDGLRAGAETCDDQNTSNGDGCSSTCTIESNYIWTGGTTSSKDTCSACPAGQPPDSGKTSCQAVWGDGLRAGSETCDDQNTSNGDGCSSTCTIESNYICTGGSTTGKDTCSACPAGQPPNSGKTLWQAVCGDGLRAGAETCDDQNTSNGDGCTSTCTIESNYIWTGGTTSSKDTCSSCPAGQPPNSGKTACAAVWGDGLRAGSEECDDQNTANSDGWSSTCTIEANSVCSGGTTSSKDTCSICTAGQPPNSGKTLWQAVCGDGLRAGAETCDDQNTSNGDGCSSTCTIESNYICTGGTTSSKDTCSSCPAGQPPNSGKTACVAVWGDGLRAGAETCDDQNTSNGDGCSSTCTIESNYIWTGGTTSSKDTCSACPAGQPPDSGKTSCQAVWGDGLRAGSETCDDQNTSNGDGCSSTCTIESNYICTGGSTTGKDTCSACPAGQPPNSDKTSWVSGCGDGFRTGIEECDDNNSSNGDGWSSTCTIESNNVWSGGSASSKDTCTTWTSGLYQNIAKSVCVSLCGDGFKAGSEKCDDQNTNNGDGWSSDWLTVELNWFWIGGSPTSKDTCTLCNNGLYINDPLNPTSWVSKCGDGFLAGKEICDDGNTINGDGWSSTCTVETTKKWVWHGGTGTTSDNCEVWGNGFNVNDSSNPRYCQSVCGDGLKVGSEVWDTGGISSSPWVKGWTTILAGFVWTGGDSNGADIWTQWPTSFTTNYNQSSCQVKPVTYAMEIYGYLYASLMMAGIICNILSAYIFGYTFVSVFSILTHVQMLLLTPLIGVTVNENIISFYRMLKDVLLGFWFVSTKTVFVGYDRIFGYDTYSQTNWYLNVVGYDSASWIYTLGLLFTVWFILLAFYGIMQLANLAFIQQNSNNVLSRLVKKIVQFMTFKLFIRFSMLIFVWLLLGTLNTFAVNKRAKDHPASLTVSVVVYTLWVAFLVFSYVLTGVAVSGNQMTKITNFAEFFNGVNLNFFSKWHSSINLTRFFLFWNILWIFAGDSTTAKLVTIILLQAIYIAYLWVVRPFKMLSDNVIDISLEVCLFSYIIALSKFDADSTWSEADITIYIVFLFVAVSVYIIFSIGNICKLSNSNSHT